jgi:MFS family permease
MKTDLTIEPILPISNELNKIEDIYNKYGYGLMTVKYIIFNFLVIASYSLHLSVFSLLKDPIIKSYNLTPIEKDFVSSIVFAGLALGSILLSLTKKAKEHRKAILLLFSLILTISHLITCLVFNSILLIIMRFFIGFSLGILMPNSYTILIEYLPTKHRALVMSSVWTGFVVSRFLLLGTMLWFMPNLETEGTQAVLLVNLSTSIVILLLGIFIKDSPRNLIIIKREEEAFGILSYMLNRPLSDTERESIVEDLNKGVNKDLGGSLKDIFNKNLLRSTICVILIWCIHSFVFYGTLIASYTTLKKIGEEVKDNRQIIIGHFIIAAQAIPQKFIIGYISGISWIGRRKALFISYTISIIGFILCVAVSSEFALFYGLSSAFMGAGNSLATAYSGEIYPTKVRESAIGFLYFISRVASSLSQIIYDQFLKVDEFFPYYISIGLIVVLLISILLLPFETNNRPLDERLRRDTIK